METKAVMWLARICSECLPSKLFKARISTTSGVLYPSFFSVYPPLITWEKASECAVSTLTFEAPFSANFLSASSFTALLKARYNIFSPGLALAYSISVVVFPEPATAFILISPELWTISICSLVKFIQFVSFSPGRFLLPPYQISSKQQFRNLQDASWHTLYPYKTPKGISYIHIRSPSVHPILIMECY